MNERTNAERNALESWGALEPPAGFAARVLEAEADAAYVPPTPGVGAIFATARGKMLGGVAAASLALSTASFMGAFSVDDPPHVPVVAPLPEEPEFPVEPLPVGLGEKIDAYVNSYGRLYGDGFRFHGVVLVARGDEVGYERAFGSAVFGDVVPNTTQTRFRFGSLSGSLTAAAVLRLAEQERLSLDDPIGKYLGDQPGMAPEIANDVTLHHLLSHTSGIFNFSDASGYGNWLNDPPARSAILEHALETTVNKGTPTPEDELNPSNTGYLMLGAVIEKVTGEALGEYMVREILKPAGMDTATWGDDYDSGSQAVGYEFNEINEALTPATYVDPRMFGGAAAVVGTARDLLAWDRALDEASVIGRDSVARMHTVVSEQYAYGWVMSRAYGQRMASHPGGIEGFNGAVLRLEQDDTVIVVLANTEAVDARAIASNVAALSYGEEVEPHAEYEEIAFDASSAASYAGAWRLTPASFDAARKRFDAYGLLALAGVSVVERGGRLLLDVPSYGGKWMHQMADATFFFKDEPGTTAQFGVENGKRKWMTIRQGAMTLTYAPTVTDEDGNVDVGALSCSTDPESQLPQCYPQRRRGYDHETVHVRPTPTE